MHLDFIVIPGENRRATAGTETAPAKFTDRSFDRNGMFGKDGGGVKQRPMMLTAIKAVTNPDPVRSA